MMAKLERTKVIQFTVAHFSSLRVRDDLRGKAAVAHDLAICSATVFGDLVVLRSCAVDVRQPAS